MMRRTAVLRALPDEVGPHPSYGGKAFVPPRNHTGHTDIRSRISPVLQNKLHNTVPFVMEYDRQRMKAFFEGRQLFHFYTRKVPEFWKNYRFYYKVGESLQEWRENRIRCRIEELFLNDAVQCTEREGFEVKRVADKLVTLIKDGSRSSRRIVQEFFEVKNWDGGRTPFRWSGVGEAGDMRAMYKALDDFPQRYKNRHSNYTRMTILHSSIQRGAGEFVDIDMNRRISKSIGRTTIVEMTDRDLSLFHRGQLITGDKGEDVWDHENDRPLLDTHRGFDEDPIGVQADDKIREKEEFEQKLDNYDYVADPAQYLGYQQLDTEVEEEPLNYNKSQLMNWAGGTKIRRGRKQVLSREEADEASDLDLNSVEEYIKLTRFNATQLGLHEDDKFYRMFPDISDPLWIEKIYKPFMRMDDKRQCEIWKILENTNIHNKSSRLLTEGLPMPKGLTDGADQDHFRAHWRKKLEYLGDFPYNDPRDKELLGAAQRDALEGKLNPEGLQTKGAR